MVPTFEPCIADEIWRRYPDYRALSITAAGFSVRAEAKLDSSSVRPPVWMDAHLEAWRAAFRKFGANPKKTPPSVDSLWKRMQKDGRLPMIDPVVDLYNALSVRFGAPFGGEDADQYAGVPRLGFASGFETFDTMRDGVATVESPESGEIMWRDDIGTTCRRWNWRQCRRTALSGASRNLWFIIDRLSPMPIEELVHAGEQLVIGLGQICPDVETNVQLLEPVN